MNLDDCHVSSFVPAATGKPGAPEISAPVPIPLRPGKNVTTASRSMEFHRRILGRQFASCIRISRIPSPCIEARALIVAVDRRKNDCIDARTTPRDHRSFVFGRMPPLMLHVIAKIIRPDKVPLYLKSCASR